MDDDAELLRRYAENRSEAAFAEIVRRHLDLVYAVALRKVGRDAHLAEDVVQQVFVDVARKAVVLARHPVLTGWLFTSTHYAATQLVRAEQRRRAREEKAEIMNELSREDETAVAIDWERLRPVLDDLVRELNERDREAVLLRYFEDRSLAEVGSRLRLSEEGARSRVDRAVEKLRLALARRGVTSSASALSLALTNQVGVAAPAGLAASVTGAALVGAAVGAGGMAGILTFMSTSKTIAGVAGLAAVLAVGVAYFQMESARRTAAALATMTEERDAMRKQVMASEKVRGPSPITSAAPSLATSAPSTGLVAKSAGSEIDYVLANPEARAAYLKRATLTLKTRFERFFQAAGLTGEQQDRFLKFAMDDAEGRLDALEMRRDAGAFDPGGSMMDKAAIARVGAFQKQRDDEVTSGLRELLGDKFKLAMESMGTVYERNVTDKLASRLYYTDSPLTAEQSEQLIKVLTQNRFVNKSDTAAGASVSGELSSRRLYQPLSQAMPWMLDGLISDAAIAQAAGVISPKQLAALRMLQAEQIAEFQVLPPVPSKDGRTGSK